MVILIIKLVDHGKSKIKLDGHENAKCKTGWPFVNLTIEDHLRSMDAIGGRLK